MSVRADYAEDAKRDEEIDYGPPRVKGKATEDNPTYDWEIKPGLIHVTAYFLKPAGCGWL